MTAWTAESARGCRATGEGVRKRSAWGAIFPASRPEIRLPSKTIQGRNLRAHARLPTIRLASTSTAGQTNRQQAKWEIPVEQPLTPNLAVASRYVCNFLLNVEVLSVVGGIPEPHGRLLTSSAMV